MPPLAGERVQPCCGYPPGGVPGYCPGGGYWPGCGCDGYGFCGFCGPGAPPYWPGCPGGGGNCWPGWPYPPPYGAFCPGGGILITPTSIRYAPTAARVCRMPKISTSTPPVPSPPLDWKTLNRNGIVPPSAKTAGQIPGLLSPGRMWKSAVRPEISST